MPFKANNDEPYDISIGHMGLVGLSLMVAYWAGIRGWRKNPNYTGGN